MHSDYDIRVCEVQKENNYSVGSGEQILQAKLGFTNF